MIHINLCSIEFSSLILLKSIKKNNKIITLLTKCIVEVLTHLIASTDLNTVAPDVSLYQYIPLLRDCYLKQVTLLYLCILSIHTRGVMFGRTESSKSNPNLIVCGSAISIRSLSPTLQLASRRWRYPESVLGVRKRIHLRSWYGYLTQKN